MSNLRDTINEAKHRFESFTGYDVDKVKQVRISQPTVFLVVGDLTAIAYSTRRAGVRGGKLTEWEHAFRKESRPLLAASADGRFLSIVGGRFEFTEAGIEDR